MTPDTTARDTILRALNACDGDVKLAARVLTEQGWPMSERTLYRRIERFRLRARIIYEAPAGPAKWKDIKRDKGLVDRLAGEAA